MFAIVACSLVISSALAVHSDQQHRRSDVHRRKTMGFAPDLHHAVYLTNEAVNQGYKHGFAPSSTPRDAFDVAEEYVQVLTSLDGRPSGASFFIRDDSYTDKNTGITHVYVRQLMNGTEIANGDMNLNIKDGEVLSYGDSFYRGNVTIAQGVDVHGQHCAKLDKEVRRRLNVYFNEPTRLRQEGQQMVLNRHNLDKMHAEIVGNVPELMAWNCKHVATPDAMAEDVSMLTTDGPLVDPRPALLQFMIAATPDDLSASSMQSDPRAFITSMTLSKKLSTSRSRPIAVDTIIDNVPETVGPVKAHLAYMQVPYNGRIGLQHVWKFEINMQDNWYEAAVTVDSPHRIVFVADWIADSPVPVAPIPEEPDQTRAMYRVFGWGVNDPDVGDRTLEKETPDVIASPVGWHTVSVENDPPRSNSDAGHEGVFQKKSSTWGNNVFAQENWAGDAVFVNNYRPLAGSDLVFDYEYNPQVTEPDDAVTAAHKYINASVTQVFYTTNMVHDLYYRYGFDEVSGNFQQHNFGRGGLENDAVIIDAQNGAGMNNADFGTPPDGQNPRCRMFLWNTAMPYRDGAFEAGVVIHELSHGLSTRLTGGPANSACLFFGEAGGMGEGWGDLFATLIRSNGTYSDYPMGAWVANRPGGIREFPLSTDMTVNPTTYKTLDSPGYWEVHSIGAVWAEILWVVAQRLITKHGFSDTLFPPAPLENGTIPEGDFYRPTEYTVTGQPKPLVPKHGNSLVLQLLINAMKLQPCNPSFFAARDAIILADHALTGGDNFCDLWGGFAERGLGPKASVFGRTPWGGGFRTNDFNVPAVCKI